MQIGQTCSNIFTAKPTGRNLWHCRWSSAWLFPSGLQCEAHRTRSAVKVQHGPSPQAISPMPLHPSEASAKSHCQCEAHRIRSALEVRHGSSPQAFNVKPAGPDQPLRFSTALPLRPYHPQRFIHQKLHANRTKMFKHFHCEAHRARWPDVEVQYGSSPHHRSIPAADIHHGSSHTKTLLAQPLLQQKLDWNPTESSSIFNATPTGPCPQLKFSIVHLLPKTLLAQPHGLPVGGGPRGNRSPTVTKLPPGTWPGKGPSAVGGFPT